MSRQFSLENMREEAEITTRVEQVGEFRVTVQQKVTSTAKLGSLVTIHDIGLNRQSYMDFLSNEYNVQLYDKFTVYHIEVPGQHEGAEQLSSTDAQFSLNKMADKLVGVLDEFGMEDVIGLGVGAGAVLLVHLASAAPDKFLGIAAINPAGKSVGFKAWGEQKIAAYQLKKKGFTTSVDNFLMWHLFGTKGKTGITRNQVVVDRVVNDIKARQNAYNLSQYVRAYMNRTDFNEDIAKKLKCNVLIITSSHSPHKKEAYEMHSKLDKSKSSILESANTINAFFEDPGKCGEGLLLFMQGLGLVPSLRTRTQFQGGPIHRTASMTEEA